MVKSLKSFLDDQSAACKIPAVVMPKVAAFEVETPLTEYALKFLYQYLRNLNKFSTTPGYCTARRKCVLPNPG